MTKNMTKNIYESPECSVLYAECSDIFCTSPTGQVEPYLPGDTSGWFTNNA